MDIKQYLTYDEYVGLGGTLSQASFVLLEFEAQKIVDLNTLDRLINLETQKQEVKMCIYSLMEEIKKEKETNGKSSESVGSYSVTYKEETKNGLTRKKEIIQTFLSGCYLEDGTPYLYCGVQDVY